MDLLFWNVNKSEFELFMLHRILILVCVLQISSFTMPTSGTRTETHLSTSWGMLIFCWITVIFNVDMRLSALKSELTVFYSLSSRKRSYNRELIFLTSIFLNKKVCYICYVVIFESDMPVVMLWYWIAIRSLDHRRSRSTRPKY